MKLTVHFDGGCRTQHGVAAGAAVVYNEQGDELATRSLALRGANATSPIAEYVALHLGLMLAAEVAGDKAWMTDVTVLGDAELIVRQVDGRYRCMKEHLQPLLEHVHRLMKPFRTCEVREFPKAGPKNKRRWGNTRTDQLANEAMDAVLNV
jgi:ribonuclease HI